MFSRNIAGALSAERRKLAVRFCILRKCALAIKTSCCPVVLTFFVTGAFATQTTTPSSGDGLPPRPERLARITATPNVVPAGSGQGTTRIIWQTGDGSPGEVRVAVAGEAEKLFARGAQGSQEADWITAGARCEFRLYSGTEPNVLLATVEVTGSSEVRSAFSFSSLAGKRIDPTRLATLTVIVLLFAGVWYALRIGKNRLAESLSVTVAVLAILFALLPVFLVEPRPLAEQPFPDAQELSDAAHQLANGNGYVTYTYHNERHPPRSPPGFPLLLTPFAAFGGEFPSNVQFGAKFFTALYVLFAVFAGWRVGGWLAAALVAAIIGFSPFARVFGSLVMSDAFAAGVTALFIPLLHRPSMRSIAVAGALAGALVAVRLPMVTNLAALFIVLPSWAFRRQLILFASPFAAAHGLYNWITFGSPFRTGYSYWLPELKSFDWSYAIVILPSRDGPWVVADVLGGLLLQWICPCQVGGPQAALPNLLFYPAVLLGVFWVFAPPFITLLGFVCAWMRRRETSAKFTLWLTALSLMLFTFYFAQGTRFMAAPATLLLIFAALAIARRFWDAGTIQIPTEGA
jgi:hypothetical protein